MLPKKSNVAFYFFCKLKAEIHNYISGKDKVTKYKVSSNDFLNPRGLAVEWGAKYAHPGLNGLTDLSNSGGLIVQLYSTIGPAFNLLKIVK